MNDDEDGDFLSYEDEAKGSINVKKLVIYDERRQGGSREPQN